MPIPLSPPPGLNSDDTAFKAEGRWADGNNIRFVNGSPQVVGEFVALFAALGGAVYNMFAIDRSGTTHIAYARGANVYVGSGAASPTDRTPASMGSGYTAYAFGAWGTDILFVPSGKTLYTQSGTSQATEITQAPDRITWMLSTSRRQVIAFGCNEVASGTFSDRCIRGSDLEDNTSWTPTSANNSFEDVLDVGGGKIVTAREVGDYVAVLTDSALFLGQFIGNPDQTYRWEPVGHNCGVVGPNAAVVIGQALYWMGHDLRLRAWSPGAPIQILACPIYREFAADVAISVANRKLTHLAYISKFNELRVHYRQESGLTEGKFIAVSLDDGAWTKGDAARFSTLTSDVLYSALATNYGTNVITADASGVVYATECGIDIAADGPAAWHITSADQYIDNSQRRMMIRSVLPDFETASGALPTNAVSLTLFVRDRPQSTAVTKGPYSIAAGATKKDFRASGKIMAAKFSQSTNVDRELRLGKPTFDVVPMGGR
jgi:hypothetical protein